MNPAIIAWHAGAYSVPRMAELKVSKDAERVAGLCAKCAHARVIVSERGSVFYQCRLSATDPNFPKYPRLPVLQCPGYKPAAAREG
ncbi:MAG TPA: hypothetical protein VF753_18595 [Terriglobales bacterium]